MPTVQMLSMVGTTDETSNAKRDISEVINLLSPWDVPLLNRVGQNSLSAPCTQVKHEWMEDSLVPPETTLASAYTAGSGVLSVATGSGTFMTKDQILMIGTNLLRVVAISGDTLTVQAGIGGTTDAAAAAAATVYILPPAYQEGGVTRLDTQKTTITLPFNYTQIIKDVCTLTGTMEVIKRYGYASERAYLEAKKVKEMAIQLERGMLYNPRTYDAGPPRQSTFGGLFHYIYLAGVSGSWDTVVNAAGGYLTETLLNNTLQAVWDAGGTPSLIVVNGYNKRLITQWTTPRIRTVQGENMGGAVIAQYESEFGVFDIMMERFLRPSDVLILTPEDIGVGPLNGRAFSSRVMPSLGDYTLTEILGEYTMEVKRASMAHAWIYGTATS